MKPLHQVLRDLEFAAGQGTLTPSFLDSYAHRHGEGVLELYGLAARNGLPVAPEDMPQEPEVDEDAADEAADDTEA